jgi:CO/xanthine dehydrogenase FAD-binding subunit
VLEDAPLLALPETVDEALTAVSERPAARVMGGGTDLMQELSWRHFAPSGFVSLQHVSSLAGAERANGTLTIGPMTRIVELERGPVGDLAPALAHAAASLGTPQVRNQGTIGGNVMSAQPYRNMLPGLIALDAEIELSSVTGSRRVPYGEFTVAPGETVREPDEVLTAIRVPVIESFQDYVKVGGRNAQFVATASAAIVVDTGQREVRLGLGNAAQTPIRARSAEEFAAARIDWAGSVPVTEELAAEFGRLAASDTSPPDDFIASAEYRQRAVEVMARRLLLRAFESEAA